MNTRPANRLATIAAVILIAVTVLSTVLIAFGR